MTLRTGQTTHGIAWYGVIPPRPVYILHCDSQLKGYLGLLIEISTCLLTSVCMCLDEVGFPSSMFPGVVIFR